MHEQVLRAGLRDLLRREPHLAADVVLGIEAGLLVEDRFADHVLGAWSAGGARCAAPLARTLPGRTLVRWLVSQNGWRRLRRHVHSATTGRSQTTSVPSGSSTSTGPSTSSGPPGTGVTRRRSTLRR